MRRISATWRKPVTGMRLDSGTKQSSNDISTFVTARFESLPSIGVRVNPGVSGSKSNGATPSGVCAQSTGHAKRVAIADPALAAIDDVAAIDRRGRRFQMSGIAAMLGLGQRERADRLAHVPLPEASAAFCASVPKSAIEPIANPECTPKKVVNDESAYASS